MNPLAKVRVLTLDDSDGAAIAHTIRGVLGDKSRCQISGFTRHGPDFNDALATNPDVAIIDYQLGDGLNGAMISTSFGPLTPKPLVVLKSNAGLSPEARAIVDSLREFMPIEVAAGPNWRDDLSNILSRWIRKGGLRTRRQGVFAVRELDAHDKVRRLELHRAMDATIVDGWLRAQERPVDVDLVIARAFAESLAANVSMEHDDRPFYVVAPHDEAAREIPWELLSLTFRFGDRMNIGTPIARRTKQGVIGSRAGDPGQLLSRGVLYVAGDGIDDESESRAIQRLAKRFGVPYGRERLSQFVERADSTPCGVLHLGMHDDGGELGGERLIQAVVQLKPAIVVLNSCNSLGAVHDNPRRYPHPLTGVERFFDSGVHVVVAHQFVLAEESVTQWADRFYEVLFAFQDVPLAVAEARFQVGAKFRRLWELSSVCIVREDSPLMAE